jgi:hypothetical protein
VRPPRPVTVLLLLLATLPASCRSTASAPPVTRPTPAASSTTAPAAQRAAWLDAFARGYFPGRSGQLFLVSREGEFLVDEDPLYSFMHGSPWSYDTHVPLLLHGAPFIRTMASQERTSQQDLVPTLAALLGTAPPASAIGRPLTAALAPQADRPRAIALFVLDGFRADYLETYREQLPTLGKLRAGGAWFGNTHVSSVPTLTAVGHANLGTGAEPRTHGLAVNYLYNRATGKSQEAYDQLDPGEMLALTLADAWNIETDGRAVIIGQGGAIRATAGLIGHGACVINGRPVRAASYNRRTGAWETSKCYLMPEALKTLNAERYWKEAGGTWMGHDVADGTKFRHSALFQRFEGDALAAVLEEAPVGADDVTDLVLVNHKGPDYVGHAYGPASAEIKAEMIELDRQLARFLEILERKAGAGRYVVAIAADHGMPGEPKPGGRHHIGELAKRLDARFSPSGGSIVQYFGDAANCEIHLDTARLRALNVSLRDVAAFLEREVPFAAVFTEDEVRAAQVRLRAAGR